MFKASSSMHYKIKQRIKKEAHEEYQILSEEEKNITRMWLL